ncbi:DUF4307 domain-containing protein [Nocardiopsis coralliicola]
MPESPADLSSDGAARRSGAAADTAAAGARQPLWRRHGSKPVFFFLALLAAAVFTFGWGTALVSYGETGGVAQQTIAWDITSESEASITFEVSSDTQVSCLVRAYDEQHVEVGQTEVELEPGTRSVTATIETVRAAVMVEVASCQELSGQ